MCARRKASAVCRGLSVWLPRELLRVVSGDLGLLGIRRGELATEALDAAGGVDQLLLAGEERVAGRADFNDDRALVGRTRVELVAAGALYVRIGVSGMNSCLWHDDSF